MSSIPAPYSLDLREKAIAAVDRGEKKSRVLRSFNISRSNLDRWLKQREEIGSIAPKVLIKKGPEPKINDPDTFRVFTNEHGYLTHLHVRPLTQ